MPGHAEVEGNEAVDKGAKDATEGKVSHPTRLPKFLSGGSVLPSSVSAIKQNQMEKLKKKWKKKWQRSPRYRRIANIDPDLPSAKSAKTVLSLTRKQTSLITQLRTGHIALNAYLFRIGKNDTNICARCQDAPETVHHFLFECIAYGSERHKRYTALGRDSDSLSFLLNTAKGIKEVSIYVNRTKRLKHIFGEIHIPQDKKRQ